MKRCMKKIQVAIMAQDPPLKLTQTRLKKRSRRPDVENCSDEVHNKLLQEVAEIQESIKLLEAKYEEASTASSDMQKNKEHLDQDIKVKKNSLLVDQHKCMSIRRTFPYLVASLIKVAGTARLLGD